MTTPILAPGPAWIAVEPGEITSRSGQTAPTLTSNGYIRVDAGAEMEVVQVTNVECQQSPTRNCHAAATFRFPHPSSNTQVGSATAGLQEAIAAQQERGGGVVLLSKSFGPGNQAMALVSTTGTVFLQDERAGGPGFWHWNGTAFVLGLPPAGPQEVQPSDEGSIFSDQVAGASNSQRIAAACTNAPETIVIVPPESDSSPLPALPPGCVVEDERGTTGNGGILWDRQLPGSEQYGFAFAVNNLSSDGESATALLGEVPAGVAGTNVVGVRGQVYSADSPAVYGVNFGSGGFGGPGVQGDTINLPGSIGVLGVGCSSGATPSQPCAAMVARAMGDPTYGAAIGLLATNDNGPPLVADLTAAASANIDPLTFQALSGLTRGTSIAIQNTSPGGTRWDLQSTGTASGCGVGAGYLAFINQPGEFCPLVIAPTAPANTLQLTSAGIVTASPIISSLSQGTAPLQVASSTPVANLTAAPAAYGAAGNQIVNAHLVSGTCVAGSACNVTFAGNAVFTSATSYVCTASDTSSASPVQAQITDSSHVSFAAPDLDHVAYMCIGN